MTQQDVARLAQVDRSSVSLALRDHPNIPAATRERIRRAAQELGYVPDPMLSALASYRHERKPPGFHGMVAWLVDSSAGYRWRERRHYEDYFQGAARRLRQRGYAIEIFDPGAKRMSMERAAGVLRARNVRGILLCPQPRAEAIVRFPWEHFSAVTFGYTLSEPKLHTVSATHYRATQQTVQELVRLGYKRIGLALHDDHDRRTDHNYRAGYLVALDLAPHLARLPILGTAYGDRMAIRRWLKQGEPDAVVCGSLEFLTSLRALGVAVPDRLGVACPVLTAADKEISGVVENNVLIGEVAADQLVSMIQRGERGVPETAQRIHVEGAWQSGATVCGRARSGRRAVSSPV